MAFTLSASNQLKFTFGRDIDSSQIYLFFYLSEENKTTKFFWKTSEVKLIRFYYSIVLLHVSPLKAQYLLNWTLFCFIKKAFLYIQFKWGSSQQMYDKYMSTE